MNPETEGTPLVPGVLAAVIVSAVYYKRLIGEVVQDTMLNRRC